MNDQQKKQVLEQIKSANHVLVTVSANPTVDELAASIGLTLALNKMDKHATTVFSGVVPSTIEFLQPEKTIETTTDSLRDFIIALDKSKADKLRYKVEDDVVRIFITPYRTSISDKDLDFSQGDFNVDAVVALGVTRRQDLDKVITEHGRILHDATILALTKRDAVSDLGAINWQDTQASSLCEMVTAIITEIQPEALDGQMATALLTGIIAETDRFKNEHTTPLALSLSSKLMSAGANQQLIAEKLEEPEAAPAVEAEHSLSENPNRPRNDNGELEIDHAEDEIDKIHIDDNGNLNLHNDMPSDDMQQPELPVPIDETPPEEVIEVPQDQGYLQEPQPEPQSADESHDDQGDDPGRTLFEDLLEDGAKDTVDGDGPTLKQPDSTATPMMQHRTVIAPPVHPGEPVKTDKPFDLQEAIQAVGVAPQIQPSAPQISLEPAQPAVINTAPVDDSLASLERALDSPHAAVVGGSESAPVFPAPPVDLSQAQEAVNQALAAQPPLFPSPTEAIGAQPFNLEPPTVQNNEQQDQQKDPNAPPPVPPPMTPQFYDADGNNANPFLNPNK